MQSSAAVAGRALIMLVCVVGIPAWALSGASWSDMVKKLQDFRWPAILNPAAASASLDESPRFAPSRVAVVPSQGSGPAPLAQISATSPVSPPLVAPAMAMPSPMPSLSGVVPVAYQAVAPTNAPRELVAIPLSTENRVDAASLSADPYHSIPERLRELGATYYLLESWGGEQQMYRFYCKMAVGGSADYTRYFETSHSDPLEAMRQVLKQVEAWRGSGPIEDVGLRN